MALVFEEEEVGVHTLCCSFDGLPYAANQALSVLEAGGFEAWVVGGWVRDCLLGRASHDVDIACSAHWKDAARLLRETGAAVHETGVAHGTITAVIDDLPIEITTYRTEGSYSDGRHPDSVTFVKSIAEDLARRDFTVNAMAWHPDRGLFDPYGGREDLAAGIIRAVGDPQVRLTEDALRVLRALRFACRLRARLEPATAAAVRSCARGLRQVASERIGQEVVALVATGQVSWSLRHYHDVLSVAVPELADLTGVDQRSPYHAYDVLEHTARVCAGVEAFSGGCTRLSLRLAALFHDVAKPACASVDETGRGHFFGHAKAGAVRTRAALGSLALPKEMACEVAALVRLHSVELGASRPVVRRVMAQLAQACGRERAELLMADLITLQRADALAKAPEYRSYAVELDKVARVVADERAEGAVLAVGDLAVSGADVMEAREMTPGPGVGMVLDQLLSAVMEEELPNKREDLLAWLRW